MQPMIDREQLVAALQQALPTATPEQLQALLRRLIAPTSGGAEDAALAAELLRQFAGQQIPTASSMISFGAGTQLGDVTISDVAGRDLFKVELQQTLIAAEQ
ncbi:MAG: hypothetical protein HGA45_44740, partial [Chloroflexales bacterium]|nr:hypothetical protein [Chloroflexales bacterium]